MPADSNRFLVRTYEAGDENAILDLFARSFHQPRTLEAWAWKFQHNPYGRERISVAFDGDRLVGHYAGYPAHFVLDGREIDTNQIGDTMTDPSIRHVGRGPTSVLGRTALHFYEHFCEGRVAFNYGFNVANIQKFSLRFLRSDRVEPVAYRLRDLRVHPMRTPSRGERWARGVTLELIEKTSAEWDELFRRVSPHYRFLARRDSAYVTWRYLDAPGVSYTVVTLSKWGTLVGWVVLRLRQRMLTVGDLLLDPDHADVFDVALRHLVSVFPADAIELWCPARPAWLGSLLLDLRFESMPEPQDLSLMCVPFTRADAVDAMRDRLYYTMGDSDLF